MYLYELEKNKHRFYEIIKYLMNTYIHDKTHDIKHIDMVVTHVVNALHESNIDPITKEIIIIAAIGHEMFDHKLIQYYPKNFKPDNILQELFPDDYETIKIIIDLCSTKNNHNYVNTSLPKEYYYVRDADRIETLGLRGTERCYNYSLFVNRPIMDGKEKHFKNIEEIKEYISTYTFNYNNENSSMYSHFIDKLIYLNVRPGNEYLNNTFEKEYMITIKTYLKFCKYVLPAISNNI